MIELDDNFFCFAVKQGKNAQRPKNSSCSFFAAFWKSMFVYDKLEVRAEFLIVAICSSMNVLRRVDISAAFWISSRKTWSLGYYLVFFMNNDEAWWKFLKLSDGGLGPSWISLRVMSIYNPNILSFWRMFFGIGVAITGHNSLLSINAGYWAIPSFRWKRITRQTIFKWYIYG